MYLFKYILKRLGLAVLTFFIIISMCFILVKLLPNKQDVGFGKSAELIKKRREMLGYDKPLPVQFWRFWRFAIVGEFGASEVIFQGRSSLVRLL